MSGLDYAFVFEVDGDRIALKVYPATDAEPVDFDLEATDTQLTSGASLQLVQVEGDGHVFFDDIELYELP